MSELLPVSFGGLLRSLRTAAGLTQEELAEVARVSYRSISDLERGVSRFPRRDTARLLADALGLSGDGRARFEAAARGHPPATGNMVSRPLPGGIAAATRTLPRDIASFTGREPEIESVLRTVRDAGAGGVADICAISGMAGVGKTALAVHVAHRLADGFPDGQIFVQLHGHTPGHRPVDPVDALASLLQASGIPAQYIPDGLEPRAWLWRDRLVGRRMLLLLDDAARREQVLPLLPGSPGTLVLVTSRRHLTALEDAHVISLDMLPPKDAAAMLVRLALRPELRPDDSAVREIVWLCGYLPLSIGMIARQLQHHPVWTAAALAGKLAASRDRLELMKTENLSVAAAFDLSYRDLTPDEQRVFRYLGLHPGTDFDDYVVAALTDCELAGTRHHLLALYDHYLLREPRRDRYQMHDLIAEYSRSLAAEQADDQDAAIDRLLAYYLHSARIAGRQFARRIPVRPPTITAGPPVCSPEFTVAVDSAAWLDAEQVNLRTATAYAASHGRAGYAVELPSAMHGYLRHHGSWSQVIALHEIALSSAREMGAPQAEADALTDIADTYYMMGENSTALPILESAITLHRQHGNRPGLANALTILGFLQHLSGQSPAGLETLTDAVRRHATLGDDLGQAGALAYRSRAHLALGSYSAAKADLDRALEFCRGSGGIVEALVLYYLGAARGSVGNYHAAMASVARSLDMQRSVGNPHGQMDALAYLSLVQHEAGEFEAAAASLNDARQLAHSLGISQRKRLTLRPLGDSQYSIHGTLKTFSSIRRAIYIYESLGLRREEVRACNALGEMTLESGDPQDAYAMHERALSIASEIGSDLEIARSLEGMGHSLLHQEKREEAEASFREALAISERLGSPGALELRKTLLDLSSPQATQPATQASSEQDGRT
ncbi:MAG TPA: tetratricopeptide repeat protein [Streptosporangiaceae bacterium]|jgi:tetratricopeptide (TPR) repeat protein/transcriptional regulator with XRE-family HTH domain